MNYPQEQIKPYGEAGTKTVQVETMFDRIAHSYDRLNHLLSWGIDRIWRRKAIAKLKSFAPNRILDVATGTGDFAIMTCKAIVPEEMVGVDISEGMMQVARKKAASQLKAEQQIKFIKDDCLNLSFSDNTFDAVTVAFGIRNFENLDRGLSEMHRVLRANGHLVVLELSTPNCFPMKQLFYIYSRYIMPLVGSLLSREDKAYTYLPQTIQAFPQGEVMSRIFEQAGFSHVSFERLTFGICTLYIAEK